MPKYDKKSQEKVGEVMHEFKQGKLKTSAGKKVTSKKQAVAIGLSEARSEGSKAPEKKTTKKTSQRPAAKKKSTGTKSKKKTA